MITKNSPCMGCSDRIVGCHTSCDKYRKYKELNEELRIKRRNASSDRAMIVSYIHDSIQDRKRGKR